MADIQITCHSCGTVNTVSEFADAHSILCRECRIKLAKPENAGKVKNKPTVRQRPIQSTVSIANPVSEPSNNPSQPKTRGMPPQHTVRTTAPVKQEAKKFKMSDAAWSWVLFIVIGATTGTIRYGGVLVPDDIERFNSLSPYVCIVVHVLICLSIAKEAVHSGIISLLLPPYMIYYMFTVSDRFYHRAILAGLAVGMGQATIMFWSVFLSGVMDAANNWIMNPFHSN